MYKGWTDFLSTPYSYFGLQSLNAVKFGYK